MTQKEGGKDFSKDSFNETYDIGLGVALRDYRKWLKTE